MSFSPVRFFSKEGDQYIFQYFRNAFQSSRFAFQSVGFVFQGSKYALQSPWYIFQCSSLSFSVPCMAFSVPVCHSVFHVCLSLFQFAIQCSRYVILCSRYVILCSCTPFNTPGMFFSGTSMPFQCFCYVVHCSNVGCVNGCVLCFCYPLIHNLWGLPLVQFPCIYILDSVKEAINM